MGDRPISENHALLVGEVWGLGIRHGLDLHPVTDAAGNYTDTLELRFEAAVGQPRTVYLVVPPPEAAAPAWLHETDEGFEIVDRD